MHVAVFRLARRDDAGSAARPSVENPLRADRAAAWLGAFARVRRRRDRPDIVEDPGCGMWTERRPVPVRGGPRTERRETRDERERGET